MVRGPEADRRAGSQSTERSVSLGLQEMRREG